MYERNDKRRLYWLMDMYLSGKMEASVFCDEFYYCYDQELDREALLSPKEKEAFEKLDVVSGRFSQFPEDHRLDAKAFYTEAQLKKVVIETKEILKEEYPRGK